jgi:hypothetical protein
VIRNGALGRRCCFEVRMRLSGQIASRSTRHAGKWNGVTHSCAQRTYQHAKSENAYPNALADPTAHAVHAA